MLFTSSNTFRTSALLSSKLLPSSCYSCRIISSLVVFAWCTTSALTTVTMADSVFVYSCADSHQPPLSWLTPSTASPLMIPLSYSFPGSW